jgi:hypothetical protein
MKRALGIAGLAVLVLAVAGCGATREKTGAAPWDGARRAVLYAGYQPMGPGVAVHRVSDAEARHDVKVQFQSWVASLARYRGGLPAALTPEQFRQRLEAAAARYHFTVKRLRFFHARVLAPLVIIQTRHYVALAHAVHLFSSSLNPKFGVPSGPPCTRSWEGSTICAPPEQMFLEAQDERGVPFLTVAMGQWARSEALYPFLHG